MQSFKILMAIAVVLGTVSVFSAPAFAADSADSGTSDSAATQSNEPFSDKQLKQFVKAQNNVQSVLKKWSGKVARAGDKKAARKKQNKAMVKAVKSSGLTPKQYNQIAQKAQKDPKLTKRIQSFMTPQ